MNTRKVKPASEKRAGFEHVSGCFKYFFIFAVNFLFWTGLLPIKVGGKKTMFEFKLVSFSSLFSFIRLFVITFPVLILPVILVHGGPCKDEYEMITGEKYDMPFPTGLKQLFEVEFCMNSLIYILPFTFAYVGVDHFTKSYLCQTEFFMTLADKPSFIDVKHVLLPIVGFLLFALGKLLAQLEDIVDFLEKGLYLNAFSNSCFFLLVHLPLHFLLAMYEQYLYQSFNLFQVMCQSTLNSNNLTTLLAKAKMLPGIMEAIQRGFGFFLLADITLMLIYWLLHLYHAYWTFQVEKELSLFQFSLSIPQNHRELQC